MTATQAFEKEQRAAQDNWGIRVNALILICTLEQGDFVRMALGIPPRTIRQEDLIAAQRMAQSSPKVLRRVNAIVHMLVPEFADEAPNALVMFLPCDRSVADLLREGKRQELSDPEERQFIHNHFPTSEGRPHKQKLVGPGDDAALFAELHIMRDFGEACPLLKV